MATGDAWWAIGANVQPVAGVGTSYSYFYGTQAAAKAAAATVVDGTVTGPFATEAAAQAAVKAGKTSSSPQAAETPSEIAGQVKSAIPSAFSLVFGNTTGLLSRILKVVFGGILLIAGVLKLSGTDKKLEQVVPLVGGPAGKLLAA